MKNKKALIWTTIFSLILVVVFLAGYIYRVDLMDIEIDKYGGHIFTDRVRADVPLREAKTIPGIDKKLLFSPDEKFIEKGKTLYNSTGTCFTCHGTEGKGDGAAAAALDPKPRNFFDPVDKWTQGGKLSQIFRSVSHGVPNTAMPAFDYLSPEDRLALATYVHSMNKELPQDSKNELSALDKEFNLTSTTTLPVNVPIAVAEKKIVEEKAPEVSAVEKETVFVRKDNSPEKKTFLKYISNLNKALVVIKSSGLPVNDRNEFVKTVTADPGMSGFRTTLINASPDELSAVISYVQKLNKM
jgi:cytochrome c553